MDPIDPVDSLTLSAALLADLVALGKAAHPEEACALLIGQLNGRSAILTRVEPSQNLAPDPKRFFEVDPALHLHLQRTLRGTDEGIIGVWHSHPCGLAEPSAEDRAASAYPGWLWLITDAKGNTALWQAPVGAVDWRKLDLEARG